MQTTIRIQQEPFDPAAVLAAMPPSGAMASFIGRVRAEPGLTTLCIEHYPGMTEREIARQIEAVAARCPLAAVTVIHRVGELQPGEVIVAVAVAADHRREAIVACEYLIDHLKTKAPFWKEERLGSGTRWVEAKASDDEAAKRWD
jgi:molybdopterin synthase catalytic subunit